MENHAHGRAQIGAKLVRLRKQRNMTQEQAARRTELPQSTISQWENGIGEPNCSALYKLCALYGASADYLIGLTDECGYYDVFYRDLDEKQTLFLQYFDRMSHRRQELLFDLLREFED